MASTKSDNSGCLVLIGIIFLVVFIANTCGGNKEVKNDTQAKSNSEQRSNTAYQRQGSVDLPVKKELSDEEKMYLDNSLSTGTMPYSQYYGKNYECPYDQCSGINVTAPVGSDIVVIIKRGNQSGKVVAHGYIRSGASFQFDIPDGTYQTFFYYGRGWNPNKNMKGGIKGLSRMKYSRKTTHKKSIAESCLMFYSSKGMAISRQKEVTSMRYFK